ncbi:LPXTG cell wall anchor domain-containing protein [Levilactobacillus brevis]
MATETLPQTNEKSTMSSFIAGVLVLLTTLGFADARRRH